LLNYLGYPLGRKKSFDEILIGLHFGRFFAIQHLVTLLLGAIAIAAAASLDSGRYVTQSATHWLRCAALQGHYQRLAGQGCQICLSGSYQNGKKYTKVPLNIPKCH
jgi:hypothetical protein